MNSFKKLMAAALFLTCAGLQAQLAPAAAPTTPSTASALPAAFPKVEIQTNLGAITLELRPDRAPVTVENFLRYVASGHYNGTIFHRVINGFMIQGGGFDAEMKQKTTLAPIKLESQNGLRNQLGTVAMARTGAPDSATAQFFINVVDNPNLDFPRPDGNGYAVFGRVISGLETVNKIKAVPVENRGPHQNVPQQPVLIQSVTLIK